MATETPVEVGGAADVAATAGAAAATGGAAAAGVAAIAGAGQIVGLLIAFLAQLRELHRAWLTRHLGRFSKSADDIAQVVAQEMGLEDEFARNSADRLAGQLPQALAIADPAERVAAVRQLLANEERYAQQRSEAMAARAIAAVTRAQLRRDSPLGAWWMKGHAKDPTPGCIFMAGGEQAGAHRFWPWPVLDRVFPPRHYGCPDVLRGVGDGIEAGWGAPKMDARDAIRAASGVVMEAQEADALLAEVELRERLVEAGMREELLALMPWNGVAGFEAKEEEGGSTPAIRET